MRDAIRHLLILQNRASLVNGIHLECHPDHSAGCQWSQFDCLIAEINKQIAAVCASRSNTSLLDKQAI